MTVWTIIGILAVLVAIIGISLYSGKKVQNADDFFTGGSKAGPWLVCGAIMGSLVSSQATIGTAQLAFHYGLSAWWFTLGSGIGCLILGLGYVRSLRNSGCVTEIQIISREYGSFSGIAASVLCSAGIFISILAQIIASSGLISVLWPFFSTEFAIILSTVMMCLYVIFGGAWGAGIGGIAKLILLYVSAISGMVYIVIVSGGARGLTDGLVQTLCGTDLGHIQSAVNLSPIVTVGDLSNRFFSLFSRGILKDLGSGLSLLLGVLSTQTYAQAIWSAKSAQAAKKGALFSALFIPPIGIAGIFIGLFMRSHYITQAEADALLAAGKTLPDMPVLADTIQVFPAFILNHLPPLLGGIILGVLFLAVIGGGAGLSFGMATILVKDLYLRITGSSPSSKKELIITRAMLFLTLECVSLIAILLPGSIINDLGFLSMGLRGTVVFMPLNCALWCSCRIDKRFILGSIFLAPLSVFLGHILSFPFDPLFLGMAVSALLCIIGFLVRKSNQQHLA